VDILEAALGSSMTWLTGTAPQGSCVFWFHAKGSWTRTMVIAAIASSRTRITDSQEESEDESSLLELISCLTIPPGSFSP